MIGARPTPGDLQPNPDWAKLPIFNRTGWRRLPFGAFAESVNERVEPADAAEEIYVGLEHLDPENLHIRRWGKGSDVIGTKLRFRKGDIIFGRRRAYQRKLAVAEFDGICSAHAMVVRAKLEEVLPEFLPFLMMSDRFMNRAVEISVGSLSPTINWKTLKNEEFNLPPLDQQRRIAEVLWAVDEIAKAQAKVNSALSNFKDAIIAKHFPHGLKLIEIRQLGRDAPGFSNLKKVADKITDGVHLTPQFTNSGVPFLLVSNLASGTINWKIDRWISPQTYEELTRYTRPEVGDVLYTVVGSFGVPVFIDWERGFSFQRHIALIKPNRTKVRGRYIFYFLQSQMGRKQAEIYAEGNAQRTITLRSLNEFVLPLPSIEEQQKLINLLDEIDSSIQRACTHWTNTKKLLHTLNNALMGVYP